MPKAKPVSLHPLSFEEAMRALLAAEGKPGKTVHRKQKAKEIAQHKTARKP